MTIYIPSTIYSIMQGFILGCEYEISGMFKIDKEKMQITDVILLKQKVSKTSTILDAEGLGIFYNDVISSEGTLENWRGWWHSHGEIETFWSATDEKTIEEFDMETQNNNWFMSIVFNHKMEYKARLDIFNPFRLTHKLDLKIINTDDEEIKKYCEEEIKKKVLVLKHQEIKIVDCDDPLSKMIKEMANNKHHIEDGVISQL